jgi:hypothetical protein
VLGQSRLYEDASAAGPVAHETRGPDHDRHCFFRSSIAGSEKFLIEIKKGHNISVVNSVERCFGTHDDSGSGSTCVSTSLGSEFSDWFAHKSFEFLSDTIDAGTQILHLRAATLDAEQRSDSVAAETHKSSIISLHHRCRALLAGCDLTARSTR